MKYEVDFVKHVKVIVEADSAKEAEDKAAVMETEEIEDNSVEFADEGYEIWNIERKG